MFYYSLIKSSVCTCTSERFPNSQNEKTLALKLDVLSNLCRSKLLPDEGSETPWRLSLKILTGTDYCPTCKTIQTNSGGAWHLKMHSGSQCQSNRSRYCSHLVTWRNNITRSIEISVKIPFLTIPFFNYLLGTDSTNNRIFIGKFNDTIMRLWIMILKNHFDNFFNKIGVKTLWNVDNMWNTNNFMLKSKHYLWVSKYLRRRRWYNNRWSARRSGRGRSDSPLLSNWTELLHIIQLLSYGEISH